MTLKDLDFLDICSNCGSVNHVPTIFIKDYKRDEFESHMSAEEIVEQRANGLHYGGKIWYDCPCCKKQNMFRKDE